MPTYGAGHFLKSFLIFAAIIFGGFLLTKPLWSYEDFILILGIALFLFVVNLISGLALAYTLMDKHNRFMMAMGGSTFLKIMLGLAFIGIFVTLFKGKAFTIVAAFFVFYMLFTGFEVFQLFRNLRPHLKKEQKSENR